MIMRFTVLVKRYAKALLDVAINNDKVDIILHDMKLVDESLENSVELRNVIEQPFISKPHKKNILEKLFKDRISEQTLNFLKLMVDKNREDIILNIYEKYYELYLEHMKIAVVTITSAVSLDDVTRQRIVNIIKPKIADGSTIEINNVINKDIIGGFIVNYKDFHYDASVKGTLKHLHNNFSENLFVKGY